MAISTQSIVIKLLDEVTWQKKKLKTIKIDK